MGIESEHEVSGSREARPTTHRSGYASVGSLRLSYETSGSGPPLVFAGSSFTNMEALWDDPEAALFFTRLARFCTVVQFDMIGVGGSDRPSDTEDPPLSEQIVAILDHLGLDSAVLLALLQGGADAIRFAVDHPERLSGLILYNSTARILQADDYEIGIDADAYRQMIDLVIDTWGTDPMARMNAPSRADDERFMKWYVRYMRGTASPLQVRENLNRAMEVDVRGLLPRVEVPTLVLSRSNFASVPSSHGRYIADNVPGAKFISVPGADGPIYWENPDVSLSAIEEFFTGESSGRARPETLTLLFTDIVGSTELAFAKGDSRWSAVLAQHDQIVEKWVGVSSGRIVKHTGDGVFVEFDGVTPALEAARRIRSDLARLDVGVRIGIHTAEVERRGDDLEGIGVVVAARVMDEASKGQILVSATVRALLLGSSWNLNAVGPRRLKGFEEEWELFELT